MRAPRAFSQVIDSADVQSFGEAQVLAREFGISRAILYQYLHA
jgi:hypothetical protein